MPDARGAKMKTKEEKISDLLESIDIEDIFRDLEKEAYELSVSLIKESIERFGAEGIKQAEQTFKSGKLPDWASPRLESDWMAFMQNVHADAMEKQKAMADKINEIAMKIGMEVLKIVIVSL
jgi:hypothetical protein